MDPRRGTRRKIKPRCIVNYSTSRRPAIDAYQQASTLQFAARRQPFGSFAQGSGLDMSASTAANDDSATPESESTTTFPCQRLLTWTCYPEGLSRSQQHTSELQSHSNLVFRRLLAKKTT